MRNKYCTTVVQYRTYGVDAASGTSGLISDLIVVEKDINDTRDSNRKRGKILVSRLFSIMFHVDQYDSTIH